MDGDHRAWCPTTSNRWYASGPAAQGQRDCFSAVAGKEMRLKLTVLFLGQAQDGPLAELLLSRAFVVWAELALSPSGMASHVCAAFSSQLNAVRRCPNNECVAVSNA